MRDGIKIYIDLFRPEDERPVPPLIAWGHTASTTPRAMRSSSQQPGRQLEAISLYVFEAPDPMCWVPKDMRFSVLTLAAHGTPKGCYVCVAEESKMNTI